MKNSNAKSRLHIDYFVPDTTFLYGLLVAICLFTSPLLTISSAILAPLCYIANTYLRTRVEQHSVHIVVYSVPGTVFKTSNSIYSMRK
jgi:hypothetical protein